MKSDIFESNPPPVTVQRARKVRDDSGQWWLEKRAGPQAEWAEQRQRLRNHHLITAGLDLPGVARPQALEKDGDVLVLRLPWLAGTDLAQTGPGHGAQPPDPTLAQHITLGAARLLAALEAQGIAHGAICAEHVLWDPASQTAALLDFGLARYVRCVAITGAAPGDAPPASPLADLRALGALFYRLSTGQTLPLVAPQPLQASSSLWHPQTIAHLSPAHLNVMARLCFAGLPGGYRSAAAVVRDLLALSNGHALGSGALGVPVDLPLPSQRLGRDKQLADLLAAYGEASERSAPQAPALERRALRRSPAGPAHAANGLPVLALVDGLAGSGKSAVVQDASQAMRRHGATVATGKFNQFGDSRPLSALAQALDGAIAGLLADELRARQQAAERLMGALGTQAGVLFDFLPRLAQLLGPQATPPPLPGEASRVRFELLLGRLIGALATRAAPLVLVIDDIQWADSATLRLLRGLVRSPSIRNLLVVGVYRSEAVDEGHGVTRLIHDLTHAGARMRRVTVPLWGESDIAALLALAGVSAADEARGLAPALLRSTGGNPFGVIQALLVLQLSASLHFDPLAGCWRVDTERAQAALGNSTPVDMVGRQLQQLPEDCRALLAAGALLGAWMDLDALAAVHGQSPNDTLATLRPALRAGFLVLLDESLSPHALLALRCAHDFVQQAAFRQLSEMGRAERHMGIGRALVAKYRREDALHDHVFEIVQQFRLAPPAGMAPPERELLQQLSTEAGRQARQSGAARTALDHFRHALTLAAASGGDAPDTLMFEAAEAAYLAADFSALDGLLDQLDHVARDVMDQTRVQELRIQGLMARNRMDEALGLGEQALARLGVPMQALVPPSAWPAVPRLDELRLDGEPDARAEAALRVLVWLTPCAYVTSFEMYIRVILSMVALARAHPSSPLTALSYTNFGLVLCGTGQWQPGFEASTLALALSDPDTDLARRCKVRTLAYGFLRHWSHPVNDSLAPLLATIEDALLCGDQEYLGYGAFLYCDKAWGQQPLNELVSVHSAHTRLVEQFGHDFSWRHCQVWLQFMLALQGTETDTALHLRGSHFDERQDIARLEGAHNSFSLFTSHTLQAVLAWHRGDWAGAQQACTSAERYAMTGSATLLSMDLRLFTVLSRLATLPVADEALNQQAFGATAELAHQLGAAAEQAPANFRHKHLLAQAERARVIGDVAGALRHFEQAAEHATQGGFQHELGLIRERAGLYCQQLGLHDIARQRLTEACDAYQAWGASAVSQSLRTRMAQLSLDGSAVAPAAGPIVLGTALEDKGRAALHALQATRLLVYHKPSASVLSVARQAHGGTQVSRLPVVGADTAQLVPLRLLSAVAERGEAVDLAQGPWLAGPVPGATPAHPTPPGLAVPIWQGDVVLGAAYLEHAGAPAAASRWQAQLPAHVQALVDELRISDLAARLDTTSLTDAQTGLPNRTALLGMIELAMARSRGEASPMQVLALRFRSIVALGQQPEAELAAMLTDAARALLRMDNPVGGLARLDRDVLGLVLTGWPTESLNRQVQALLGRIVASLPLAAQGVVSLDAGVRPDDGATAAAALLHDAEASLSTLPRRGGHAIALFDRSLHGRLFDREILARDLRWALAHSGLHLVYQPVVDMRDNRLLGAEALVRWRHPARGNVPANLLVEVAEEFGLIDDLGQWLVEEALRAMASWSGLMNNRSVSINASPIEIQHADYAQRLADAMRRHGIRAEQLAVEITESTAIEDDLTTQLNLQALRKAGIMLCIDDFGVGMSSLHRLHATLANRLKIDRCFVEGITEDAGRRRTIEMIIKLAESLQLDVVCEGVSRAEHVDFLVGHGLHKAQGYYYPQPVTAGAMRHLLEVGYVRGQTPLH
jgi:EAL domain-containing protein (putative c-di-GMP-specific phosphodiesterase class I)/predicted ATPase/GGDEF domain-containing protein